MKKLILTTIIAAALVSCTSVSGPKKQVSISGTSWILADQVKGNAPTLMIEDGKINGNAGCNNYFGQVNMDATVGNFSAGNVGATKKMCENMSVEDNYLKLLGQVNKYKVNGKTLELYKDNLLLLKFNKN